MSTLGQYHNVIITVDVLKSWYLVWCVPPHSSSGASWQSGTFFFHINFRTSLLVSWKTLGFWLELYWISFSICGEILICGELKSLWYIESCALWVLYFSQFIQILMFSIKFYEILWSFLLDLFRVLYIFFCTCKCFLFFFYLFVFYFWLCWVFVSVWGLSLVVASGGHSSSRCAGLSLSRPLLLQSTGSRRAGSVVVAHRPSCSAACGIFPDQGSNPCPLHWQADS